MLKPFRLETGTPEQGMVKVTVISKDGFKTVQPIESWLKENLGPQVVKRSNKTYSRKKWSIRCVQTMRGFTIDVFFRDPAHATLFSLKWL